MVEPKAKRWSWSLPMFESGSNLDFLTSHKCQTITNCTFNNRRGSPKQLLDQFLACSTAALSLTSLVTQKPAQLYQMPLVFGNTPPADHSQNGNSICQSNSKCHCLPVAAAREFPIKHKAKHGTGFPEKFLNLHLWRFSKFKWTWPWIIFSTFENSLWTGGWTSWCSSFLPT